MNESNDRIIEIYRGLWMIEESFKIAKSIIGASPVYLYRPYHINAHFLVCFISLVLARFVEIRLNNKYPITEFFFYSASFFISHKKNTAYNSQRRNSFLCMFWYTLLNIIPKGMQVSPIFPSQYFVSSFFLLNKHINTIK